MIFLKIFYWIILIFSWIMVIKYRKIVYEWIWRIDFIEKYLWIWSTITFIILIWLILIFIGVVYPAWYFEFKSSFDNENNDFLINTQNTN
jgi:cbb3-type cytochrome oxidase subunit 3